MWSRIVSGDAKKPEAKEKSATEDNDKLQQDLKQDSDGWSVVTARELDEGYH